MIPSAPIDPLTALSASRRGVYLHFPYCLSKCPYCDFASVVAREIPSRRYTDAVLAELSFRAEHLDGRPVESVFFGGGTPSLWPVEQLALVLSEIDRRFGIASGAEVSLEANPGAADAARFTGYRAAGVNRLSIGVQSFWSKHLLRLGRSHTADQAEAALSSARAAGFENVSLDLIYGLPDQTLDELEADLRRAVGLRPEHLSCYALTLEKELLAEEVPLSRQLSRGELSLPDEAQLCRMSETVESVFAEGGYRRYEISNYAQPGYHSRHNALYWTGGDYLGLGAGATGFFKQRDGGLRYSNHRSPEKYFVALAEGRPPEQTSELLSQDDLFSERLAMGLRLSQGVALANLCQDALRTVPEKEVSFLCQANLASWKEGRLALTARGLNLHSEIVARLLASTRFSSSATSRP